MSHIRIRGSDSGVYSTGLRNITLEDGRMVDDVRFIFGMISRLIDEDLADPELVYLTGFSDGAIMSYKLLCLVETPFRSRRARGWHDVSAAPRQLCGDRAATSVGHRGYQR